jgi:RimJ/RimL family protein N-acetyltransferase
MKAAKVKLTQEVTRNDALSMIDWMECHEVTKYMNEAGNIALEINDLIKRVNLSILTHLFNQDGSFYIISTVENLPIGFVKLKYRNNEAEMVVMIGEKQHWGNGYGKEVIREMLNHAFFHRRVPRVIAKIHPNNIRSIKAFERSGFLFERDINQFRLYSITLEEFIQGII